MSDSPIEKEVAFFEQKRAELLAQAPGQFVLIKDEAVVGMYPTRDAALAQGYDLFGPGPFLVRLISADDETVLFTAFAFP